MPSFEHSSHRSRENALLHLRLEVDRVARKHRVAPLLHSERTLCCGSRLRKGEVFAYVGLPQNLKDLKAGLKYSVH